jgi:hypothetical protein
MKGFHPQTKPINNGPKALKKTRFHDIDLSIEYENNEQSNDDYQEEIDISLDEEVFDQTLYKQRMI